MNLFTTISLFASDIGDAAQQIFHKKLGKTKGLDDIESEIRYVATKNARRVGGKIDPDDLDDYIKVRMGYMRNSFKQLNNPKTDKSKQRVDLIDDTESRSAKWFGKAKGYKGKDVYKIWVDNDGCDDCSANADEGPIPVDEEFQSGHFAPLAHPNCECELQFVRLDQ